MQTVAPFANDFEYAIQPFPRSAASTGCHAACCSASPRHFPSGAPSRNRPARGAPTWPDWRTTVFCQQESGRPNRHTGTIWTDGARGGRQRRDSW